MHTAKTELEKVLVKNGFQTLEKAEQTLLTLGDMDGEVWLKTQQNTLTEYRTDLKSTNDRIGELEEQTKDITYTNLAILNQNIEKASEAFHKANEVFNAQNTLLSNHRDVREKVSQAKRGLAKSEQAWKRLDLLANLAIGVNGDGGKQSFDRYVMGSVFREVLEMANRRLNIMSSGKYELIHQTKADRKNTSAGLDVDVLDMTTGKQRDSASLSGGESFLVSLSLALGLSDVVQSHAGGKKLDALFIDEGFGSLDNSTLDTALDVLNQLTEGSCLVGIISHVSKLEESIPQKIRVKNSEKGSSLRFE